MGDRAGMGCCGCCCYSLAIKSLFVLEPPPSGVPTSFSNYFFWIYVCPVRRFSVGSDARFVDAFGKEDWFFVL